MDKGYAAWAARWRVPLGFAMGVAYLIFSQPTLRLLVVGGGVAMLGLFVRAFAAGYLEKNHSLATSGPYAYTRNPLYLGSLLIGLGFAVAGNSWLMGLAFLGLFTLVYWPVMLQEGYYLRQHFGERYERYAASVPVFFPVFSTGPVRGQTSAGEEKFKWERYRNNREYEATLGVAAGIVFLALKLALR